MSGWLCGETIVKWLIDHSEYSGNISIFALLQFSSKIIEQAVEAFAQLPGVGKKTALRYVLHVIKQDKTQSDNLSKLVAQLKTDLKFCNKCHNISEQDTCDICLNPAR